LLYKYEYKQLFSDLEKIHDEIKRHPFRISFAAEDVSSYKHLLYELTEVWSKLIYCCEDILTINKTVDKQFGRWIHNYRQELRTYKKETFPMEYFDYYDQILQLTHRYISTGVIDKYYEIDVFFDKDGNRSWRVEKYDLITKDICGINSPILPQFLPVKYPVVTDEDKMHEYFLKDYYTYPNKSEEEREALFNEWKQNVLPVLLWVNENYKKGEHIHRCWESHIK